MVFTEPPTKGTKIPHILIVEDNHINQLVIEKLLEKKGFLTDVVSNGKEAIQALSSFVYDLILMDIQMPEMDGIETCKYIRNLKWCDDEHTQKVSKIPIIALTAHAMKQDRELCLAAGMNDYIPKPIVPELLIEAIHKIISQTVNGDMQNIKTQTSEPESSMPAPVHKPQLKIFDYEKLLEFLDNDRESCKEMTQLFIDDTETKMKNLASALGSSNINDAKQLAHSLKGSSAMIYAESLQWVFEQLENACELNKAKNELMYLFSIIPNELNSLKIELDTLFPIKTNIPV